MMTVLGNRIYIHEKDTSAVRVTYKDCNDTEKDFEANDLLYMNIRNKNDKKLVLTKVSERLKLKDREVSIINFSTNDSIGVGDYIYELLLESGEGEKITIIDSAPLHVLESLDQDDIVSTRDSDSNSVTYLCRDSLVCSVNYVKVVEEAEDPQETTGGELIIF